MPLIDLSMDDMDLKGTARTHAMHYVSSWMDDLVGGCRVVEHACLYVLNGPCAGTLYEVRRRTVVGREPSCDITLSDDSISREHAMFIDDGITFTIADVASTNGTLVNGVVIEHPTALKIGDRITVGPIEFEFLERRKKIRRPRHRETQPDIAADAPHRRSAPRPRDTTQRIVVGSKPASSNRR